MLREKSFLSFLYVYDIRNKWTSWNSSGKMAAASLSESRVTRGVLFVFYTNFLVMNESCGNFFLDFGNDDFLLFGVKQDIKYQLRKMNHFC